MSIKFKSKLSEIEVDGKIVQNKHRVIKHTDTVQDLVVTVITKTVAHPEYGNGSASGFTIDEVEGAYLEFTPGITYKFDQSDSSNANHPLRFYEDSAKATAYTTGVTTSGTPGSSGAYTQIAPTASTPPVLFYQCSAHSLMGSYVKFGTGTVGDTYSLNATTNGVNVDLNLDAASGTDSAVQLTPGQNIVLTRNSGTQVSIAAEDYQLQSVQDGSNIDLNLTSGTGNDNSTVQLTAGSNVTLTSSNNEVTIAASAGLSGITVEEEAGPLSTLATALNFVGDGVTASGTGSTKTITIPGGGGGSDTGTVTIEKDIFDGSHATDPTDGSNTTFDLTSEPAGKNNLQVYVDGVYQAKENFSLSGSTLTISPAPPSGVELEVIHIKAITGQITLDKFDGDNSTTAFTMSKSIDNENNLQVYINGVYQSKDTYSTSGPTLTLTTAPATGAKIEVVHIKAVDVTSLSSDVFTGNGTKAAYDLTATPSTAAKTLVFIQGVYQEKSTYSISGNTITFTTAPPDGYTIEVTVFGRLAVSENTVTVERFTGDSTETSFVLTASPSANNLDVYISGLYQNKNSYTYSAGTITFDEAPDTGAVVEAKYIANITQVVASSSDFYEFQWVSTTQTANFTAVANRGYFVDTSSSAITVTLPSSPSVGDVFRAIDTFSSAETYNITLARNGNKINGSDANYNISAAGRGVEFVYTGSAKGWFLASDNLSPETVDNIIEYVVVAGGGEGGSYLGGGGGAGGFRSGTFTPTTAGVQYTATVGPGGAGGATGTSSTSVGGTNSSLSGTGITTITATGGGGGGRYSAVAGSDGGSGGGGGTREGGSSGGAGGNGNEGNYNPSEGYNGSVGSYRSSGQPYGPTGNGGGASEEGGPSASNTSVVGVNQKGGDGVSNSITGLAVVYAGGGGGGNYSGTNSQPGGLGGGGNGSFGSSGTNANGGDGTDGLGGGGGGGGGTLNTGGAGGDGVVILKIPTSLFTDTYTGSPTKTTSGDHTILKFTSSGSYTH